MTTRPLFDADASTRLEAVYRTPDVVAQRRATLRLLALQPGELVLDLTVMWAFHDAFRRDLGHLAHTASRHRAQLEEPNRHAAVQAGWELFKTQLHIHHTAEDADLWPRMRTHMADRPDELALLQAMQDEHAHIDPMLAAVDGAFADRAGGHQRLGDTVDALAGSLNGHLTHEERDVLPLIDLSLTQAE